MCCDLILFGLTSRSVSGLCDFSFKYDVGCDVVFFFFFKQKTAYEIVSRDWSSDVCSSDLPQQEMGSIKSGGAAATRIGQ